MSQKVIVAGAGHGGLVAAAMLSREGFDVTVLEKQQRDEIGYDWNDCMNPAAFDKWQIPRPSDEELLPFSGMNFLSPDCSRIVFDHRNNKVSSLGERKTILKHLLSFAEQNGAALRFGVTVGQAQTEENRVIGLQTSEGDMTCDLLIDACGADSPVRQSLPESFGILNQFAADDTLYTYRAFYERTNRNRSFPKFTCCFYHNGVKSLDWMITEEDYVDVLITSFGGIDEEIIQNGVNDFRRLHSGFGTKVMRGGQVSKIPVRRTLPVFVADGYAAVGDSAAMVEPLSGSGITRSVEAGVMLAQVAAKSQNHFTKEELWAYEALYFERWLKGVLRDDATRKLMLSMTFEQLNDMFLKKVITAKELCGDEAPPNDQRNKTLGILTTPGVVPALLQYTARDRRAKSLIERFPQEYDEKQVRRWADAYEKF